MNRKIRVLLCLSRFGIGGIQSFVISLANELAKREDLIVSIYCYHPELVGENNSIPLNSGIKLYTLSRSKFWVAVANKLRNLTKRWIKFDIKEWMIYNHFESLIKNQVDIIHSNSLETDEMITNMDLPEEIVTVVTSHGNYDTELGLDLKKLVEKVNAYVYIAEKNLHAFHSRGLHFDIETFIPNGVNLTVVNREIDRGNEPISFVMVARGVKEKGWDIIVKATEHLNLLGYQFEVHLVGDVDWLIDVLNETEINNIYYHGLLTDVESILSKSDIGLLPTYLAQESMPYSIIEYLSLGLPVIATDIGSIKNMLEVEEMGKAGCLLSLNNEVPPISYIELSDKMKLYIENRELIKVHSEIAHMAFEKFSIKECEASYYSLYQKLLKA